MTTPAELTTALKAEARRLGFELAGACPAVSPPGLERFRQWLADGYAGQMHYLATRAEAYEHPRHVLDGARSLLMLAMNYRTAEPTPTGAGQGRVSRYAWGLDYHDHLHQRLQQLADYHRHLAPEATVRGIVDTAPLLEREFAQLAGLGWIGKNTLLLNRPMGSWFFLAALVTSAELEYDPPNVENCCGACQACLEACPTGALVEPYRLDARRCLSYLTIELREAVPTDLRGAVDDWFFGCDVCQQVCPWNRRAPSSLEASFRPQAGSNPVALAELFELDEAGFRQRFRHTPFWRAKRRGLLRNAALVLGNHPTPAALPALVQGLNAPEPLVRGACAWALRQLATAAAREALQQRLAVEEDPEVRQEIRSTDQDRHETSASPPASY